MTLFKCKLADETVHLQDADYYEIVQYETINDMKETSIVTEYVFWKSGKDIWRIPALFVDNIREVG